MSKKPVVSQVGKVLAAVAAVKPKSPPLPKTGVGGELGEHLEAERAIKGVLPAPR